MLQHTLKMDKKISMRDRNLVAIAVTIIILKMYLLHQVVLQQSFVGYSQDGHGSQVDSKKSGSSKAVKKPVPPLNDTEIEKLASKVYLKNTHQEILNLVKFGDINEKTNVLLIQVHSRLDNLKLLIKSLKAVQGIQNSLLIFSHDIIVEEINEIIEQIDFTRVLQIYYPHSIQLHPNKFPGPSLNDCPKRISLESARKLECGNANYPDIYGNYREAPVTQVKHHWWWKINFVFRQVSSLQNHTGVVLFLEEDEYVAPDLLWTLNIMESYMRENQCEGCGLLDMGSEISVHKTRFKRDEWIYSQGVVTSRYSTRGIAFNRTFWEAIEKCTLSFCDYDDYNWDFSLKYVFRNCMPHQVFTFFATYPRINHNGLCNGLHKKNSSCTPESSARQIENEIWNLMERQLLFPKTIILFKQIYTLEPLPERYGGWGDIRDKLLCMSFSKLYEKRI